MKEKNIGYQQNIIDAYEEFMSSINDMKEHCNVTPLTQKKKMSQRLKGSDKYELKKKTPKDAKLSKIIQNVASWTNWTIQLGDKAIAIPVKFVECVGLVLGETTEFIAALIKEGIDIAINWVMSKIEGFINDKIVIRCLKYLKLASLYIKKYSLIAEREIQKILKKILENAKNGKFIDTVEATLNAILTAIKAISGALSIALGVIDNIVKLMSATGMSLNAEGMAFFLTPKTVASATPLKSETTTSDNFGGIPVQIIDALDNALNPTKQSMASNKRNWVNAHITAAASGDIPDIPDVGEAEGVRCISTDEIKSVVTRLLSLFIAQQPLPKFEQLHPGNIRYLMWLMLSFNPAMKKAFGLPGYP